MKGSILLGGNEKDCLTEETVDSTVRSLQADKAS